ncbi:MAG: hypothetical protein E7028_07085 [Planctomycetaceae bacterium]|nr:hypothetical protein [Planctomycetaceae bacterium]MBQ2820605.1 hypothetical protein [Thermoguttaceae bacterium]
MENIIVIGIVLAAVIYVLSVFCRSFTSGECVSCRHCAMKDPNASNSEGCSCEKNSACCGHGKCSCQHHDQIENQ